MDKRELAKQLRGGTQWHPMQGGITVTMAAAEAGAAALEREAEREEKERKVTLEEMADAIGTAESVARMYLTELGRERLKAAASTLKRLAEEGGKWVRDVPVEALCGRWNKEIYDLLRSLGVEPKP